ncbi:transporter associated domain protein [Chlamydia ibidis]|uniref:Transporter associated domain protein n=2 Tax=Chlamydia ibidis TaxID=1405396 RepID=S7J624_9CHLA|nr:hemolysin family protein [Chlamydia ibidis]EPP35627.1 transporter associated domain protein [Chlamydia ibidis]EQM62548.1 CBS domain protein [Chlamydia ibidis 10-1398/6]
MISTILTFLIILFTLCSGFISLSQIALFSLPTSLISHYKRSKYKKQQLVASLLSHPHHLLITLIFCDIGLNIGIQNCVAILVGDNASWLLTVGFPLALTLILCEILPKAVALPYNAQISGSVAPVILIFTKILRPLLDWAISGINYIVQKLLANQQVDIIQPQELKEVLQSCKDFGVVNQEESRLLYGYLSLSDCSVKERMKPRQNVLFYDIQMPIDNLYNLFSEKHCSRVPVCNNNLQNLLGICTAKTLLLYGRPLQSSDELLPLLKKPYYMPETISAKTALCHLAAEDETLGMIIDEYGSIEGLITQEDLFEIVSGEIIDQRKEKVLYTMSGKNVIIATGTLELSDLSEIFNINLPTNNNSATLGGWLTEQVGSIPSTGTKLSWNNLVFQILDAAPNRVRRVYIRKMHD